MAATVMEDAVESIGVELVRATREHVLVRVTATLIGQSTPDAAGARLLVRTADGKRRELAALPALPRLAPGAGWQAGFAVPARLAEPAGTTYALQFDTGPVLDLPQPVERPLAGRGGRRRRELETGGRTLREHTAHGTMINAAFLVTLSTLSLLKGFVLAHFLSRSDYGLWGIIAVALGTLALLKTVGIGDKYLQQDDPDQEAAFQRAFTLEVISTGAFTVLILLAAPVISVIYGDSRLLAPSLAVAAAMPAVALQAPLWVYSRNMNFLRQRVLQAADPVVGFVVAIALAAAGAGVWAFAGAIIAGSWSAAAFAIRFSPYPLRLRFDARTTRSYFEFSWPLFISSGSSLVVAQSAVLVGKAVVGLQGIGSIALASNVSTFAQSVDGLVTGTMYPAVCAVQDRLDLLHESFVKSNRLALMWALPFGAGLALFAGDLVEFLLGERWRPAIFLLQALGVGEALGHLGFNWDAYMRASGRTRAIAVASVVAMVVFLVVGLPLLIAFGITGFALATGVQTVAHVIMRGYYLQRLFAGFSFVTHIARSVLPTVPAVGAVLAVRTLVESGTRSAAVAIAEVIGYGLMTAAITAITERALLTEAMGYVRRRPVAAAITSAGES